LEELYSYFDFARMTKDFCHQETEECLEELRWYHTGVSRSRYVEGPFVAEWRKAFGVLEKLS
jgi:hypothetical protein